MAEELAAECLAGAAQVVFDPAPGEGASPWRTYRACLEAGLAVGASHIFVVQDDVIVCGNLLDGVRLAVAARPEDVLCFFVPGRPAHYVAAIDAARAEGRSWAALRLGTWVPVVATLWTAAVAQGMVEWYDEQRYRHFVADDEIAGRYLAHVGLAPLASVPSLVEHTDTVPSVMNAHRRGGDGLDPGRRAHLWMGDLSELGCDAAAVDWTLGP